MIRRELIQRIAKETGLSTSVVESVVSQFTIQVKEEVSKDGEVIIRGFGSFSAKTRAKTVGRNITANKTIVIPARKIPHFKPYNGFKNSVKKIIING